jgi:hypothetical protein
VSPKAAQGRKCPFVPTNSAPIANPPSLGQPFEIKLTSRQFWEIQKRELQREN